MSAEAPDAPSAIELMLAQVRHHIQRVDPAAAAAIQAGGGLLVDIRPAAQRAREGEIPGSLIIERNDLEWRLDPTGAHRHVAVQPDSVVVVVCQEGYASSLAAASLGALGLTSVSDLDGGFAAWRSQGRPVSPGPSEPGTFV